MKFSISEKTGSPIGFVTTDTITGRLYGVRHDSPYLKKICVVSKTSHIDIVPNVLYDCTLIRMRQNNGYVVIEAEPVKFKAVIKSRYIKNNIYTVDVEFGNKKLRFDPFNGTKKTVKDLGEFREMLAHRLDIRDLDDVLKDFDGAARRILQLMAYDKYNGKRI